MTRLTRSFGRMEQVNFLLTNRIPRHLLTHFMGWYSRIENPLITRVSMFVWRLFADDINLEESKHSQFSSLHQCFIRELKPGARPLDTRNNIVISPCDAIVGACGKISGTTVLQAKGYPYELNELIPDEFMLEKYRNGSYVTLRLKSSMYHRFHAPLDCAVSEVTYISGDVWNVNPVALKRIDKLFCKNERAVIELHPMAHDHSITLVPVAAVLVASMKFNCLNFDLDLKYAGPNKLACNTHYTKGDEMGYFQHGSTIIVFASENYECCEEIEPGKNIRMGEPLLIDALSTN